MEEECEREDTSEPWGYGPCNIPTMNDRIQEELSKKTEEEMQELIRIENEALERRIKNNNSIPVKTVPRQK